LNIIYLNLKIYLQQNLGEKMGKKYLGRNINMFLILVIIISISSLVGMSTYYGYRYQKISSSHNDMAKDLQNTTALLDSTLSELNQLKNTLSQTSTDIQKYDELYLSKVSQLEKTQNDLSKMQADLNSKNVELITISNTLLNEQRKITLLQSERNELKVDIKNANNKISNCQDCANNNDDKSACDKCFD
jgi:chromosome segregation ATPase